MISVKLDLYKPINYHKIVANWYQWLQTPKDFLQFGTDPRFPKI